MRKQDMRVGETYRIVKKEYGYPAGTEVVYKEDDGTQCVAFTFPSGLDLYLYCSDVEPTAITFDQMMEAFKKHLPTNTDFYTMGSVRGYRSRDDYLNIKLDDCVEVSFHRNGPSADNINGSLAQTVYHEALNRLKAYEVEQAPVEMTIGEIADKLGIDSSKLKIKE